MARLLAARNDVLIPKIYWERSSRRVLTMDFIDGIKISDVDALHAAGVDTAQVAAITSAGLAALSTAQLNALSTDQMVALGSAQVLALTTQQLPALQTADLVDAEGDDPANWQLATGDAVDAATLRDIVAKLAKKHHAPLVRFQRAFDDATRRAPAEHWIWDSVHPTYNGHQIMADEWERAVREFSLERAK